MPGEFLTDDEAAASGRYAGPPSQADLERVFFLDHDDLALVGRHRGEHMRAGFALQLVTVRWLGTFLEDPLNVPGEVLGFVAGQLGMADPSQVKRYTEREKTRFDHQWEIRRACGYRELSEAEAEFSDVARSILVINWHLLANPAARFTDLGHGYYQARLDTDRKLKNHIRQIRALGFDVTLTKAA
jgi:TnpA family transposase